MNTLSPYPETPGADRSDLHPPSAARSASATGRADVEIVIPVHNERRSLERSVRALHRYREAQAGAP